MHKYVASILISSYAMQTCVCATLIFTKNVPGTCCGLADHLLRYVLFLFTRNVKGEKKH